ncbi:MAG: FtsX-like permease family protein [Spirochaetaceae bacterium]|nr:MAG: FtsX-like permease family protein [Spirochaetaceae bacterium]
MMSVLVRIALRNLWQHKGKTLIIGSIVAVGVLVLIVGNSLMETASLGIRRAFVDNYTGHIFISGVADGDISLFGVQSIGGIDRTPTLPEYRAVVDRLEEIPAVGRTTPQMSSFGLMRPDIPGYEGLERGEFSVLFGVDPDTYFDMFESIEIVSGRLMRSGERGVMISEDRVQRLERSTREALDLEEYTLEPNEPVRIVSGFMGGLPRIRIVPLIGVYRTTAINDGVGSDLISYIDAQTLRALEGLSVGITGTAVTTAEETALLDSSFDDAFFFDIEDAPESFELTSDEIERLFSTTPESEPDSEATTGRIESLDTSQPAEAGAAPDTGPWQFILAYLDNPRADRAVVAEMNAWFAENGIAAHAGNWEAAAGPFATTADLIRAVFNAAVIIVGIVAVIIIMNTLVISVIERTSEIGTMRALGAHKSFVWRMFFTETVTITTVFGSVGIAASLATIGILNMIGIPATNPFLTVLFAGPVLRPVLSITAVVFSILIVTGIAILSHVYPVSVALKVQPIKAIQTE